MWLWLLVATAAADPCARETLIGRAPTGTVLESAHLDIRVRTRSVRIDGMRLRTVRRVTVEADWGVARSSEALAIAVTDASPLHVQVFNTISDHAVTAPAWTFCERGGPLNTPPAAARNTVWRVPEGQRTTRTRFHHPATRACRLRFALDAAWSADATLSISVFPKELTPDDWLSAIPPRDVVIDLPRCG